MDIRKIIDPNENLACITLDFELDYGGRSGEFNILKEKEGIEKLSLMFERLGVPLSMFVVTNLFESHPECIGVIESLAQDIHCHSHSHDLINFNSVMELSKTAEVFERNFDKKPIGYRAPQGVLYPGDIQLLKEKGFKFSASVFPSFRPGKFNNLSMPLNPFIYQNGICELPFAVIPHMRYTISLSYLKLLCINVNKALFAMFGLPKVLVLDSHLHDYIVNEKSFNKLPAKLRAAWSINKYSGMSILESFVTLLKKKGYKFITMTELYNKITAV